MGWPVIGLLTLMNSMDCVENEVILCFCNVLNTIKNRVLECY